ncbi:nitroreductase family protein [Desulfopila sp. IMCC35008]|uniref:nitroreductase family protein n=1 Tax=Desulfopila sp. IMCC35008 TaxID=2653858 RepID=UPI0013D6DD4B|nr:nitroreductase family protein [Desulfopila sp. IMCC35008]
MDLETTIAATRTYRRFNEKQNLTKEALHQLIDLARLAGSSRNCQAWQYMIITENDLCEDIFPYLGWAGYLQDWKGPASGERPAAYVLCLLNHDWLNVPEKLAYFDLGISSQNLLLGAIEKNIGGCRIGAFSPKLADLFNIPPHLTLELVIALGVPAEKVVIEKVDNNNTHYWRDENDIHRVPKRTLEDIIISLDRK